LEPLGGDELELDAGSSNDDGRAKAFCLLRSSILFLRSLFWVLALSSRALLFVLLVAPLSRLPFIMSTFSFDNWDQLLTASTEDVAPTPSALSIVPSLGSTVSPSSDSSSPSASSGEFQPFSAVGASLSGGGGRKTLSLVYGGRLSELCCGVIGTSKFCLKLAICGVAAHSKKFEWDSNHFYLKENETRAFIKPTFTFSNPDSSDIDALLGVKLSAKEFTVLFEDLQEGRRPEWMPAQTVTPLEIDPVVHEDGEDELTSPKFASKDSGIFALVPALSFDSDGDESDYGDAALSPEEITSLLREYKKRFTSLKHKWTQTFLEVEASHTLVIKDLLLLHKAARMLKTVVGVPDLPLNMSVATSLQALSDDVKVVVSTQADTNATVDSVLKTQQDFRQTIIEAVEENESHFSSVTQEFKSMKDFLNQLNSVVKEHEKRFGIIFPILKEFKRNSSQPQFTAMAELQEVKSQVVALQQKFSQADQDAWTQIASSVLPTSSHIPPPVPSSTSSLEATLLDLKHQVKVLQHRIVGGGIKIGNKVFQSFEDVQIWVKAELPTRRYGLFVDAVSILDFFSFLGHIDAESQVSTLHNANKAGFTSIYESRVATSVQNIFPKVFGKGDSHQYLPAVRHPDKWDDGSDGLMYQITKGMTDVETQLSSTIDTVLDGYHEARTLASQCLFKAKRFVIDLCTFMSQDYFKWKARGHSKQDAWNMTSLCVRRIFEEIHSERVVARDIYDPNNLEFTTAKMLWATWKAHSVMEQYLKHHFYEHPSISAVLARHLADNYVKPESTSSGQLATLEKAIKGLTARVDKLDPKEDQDSSLGKAKSGKTKRGTA